MILFTADWHIKLGQKNVPVSWAKNRYLKFFDDLFEIERTKNIHLHIVGGDIFDRMPTLEELELYFDWVKAVTVKTIIYDGNHEATKKNKTFFTYLKEVTHGINNKVTIIDENFYDEEQGFGILPYCELHKKDWQSFFPENVPIFTHVRGEIPPHVKPEVSLDLFDKFSVVFAGDLHAHSNCQRNIVYPGSPMTTSFHRNNVETGYILIDSNNYNWTWHKLELPQLIRKTVSDPIEMISTDYDHTVYEIEGNMKELADIKDSELLSKKIVKRNTEVALILDEQDSIQTHLEQYLTYILKLDENTITEVVSLFNDYAKSS